MSRGDELGTPTVVHSAHTRTHRHQRLTGAQARVSRHPTQSTFFRGVQKSFDRNRRMPHNSSTTPKSNGSRIPRKFFSQIEAGHRPHIITFWR